MQTRRRLSHAQGYLGLGMLGEAAAELDRIPAPENQGLDVLSIRVALLQAQENWSALTIAAGRLVQLAPAEPAGWVTWAYAMRRAESLAAAEKILLAAEHHHPAEPTIQFNLGCYACLQGDLATARRRVDRAIALDPKFSALAQTDPDLAALRG